MREDIEEIEKVQHTMTRLLRMSNQMSYEERLLVLKITSQETTRKKEKKLKLNFEFQKLFEYLKVLKKYRILIDKNISFQFF